MTEFRKQSVVVYIDDILLFAAADYRLRSKVVYDNSYFNVYY